MLAAAADPARVRSLALLSPWVLASPTALSSASVSDLLQLPLVGPPLARLAIARARRSPDGGAPPSSAPSPTRTRSRAIRRSPPSSRRPPTAW